MRNTPTTDEQAQENLQATKALLGLQQRGYLCAPPSAVPSAGSR
ncbi:hypothetical protein SALBM311S_10409 [Streptomyces alboniger]